MLYLTVYICLTHCFVYTNGINNFSIDKIYIPKTIEDVQDQIKDEHHINPKSQQELETLLARSEYFLPNFDEDVFKLNSERFDKAKAIYEIKKKKNTLGGKEAKEEKEGKGVTKGNDNILRQGLSKKDRRLKRFALRRAFALMTQFVYAARYKLAYGQILRTHYKNVMEYQIGYCFALMRDIRTQEMVLYSTMAYNYAQHQLEFYSKQWSYYYGAYIPPTYSYADFHSYFLVYEKICKLDVNMLDVVNLVQRFINIRATSTTRPRHRNFTTSVATTTNTDTTTDF